MCMPCRLNRRRLWTGRLLLESTLHPFSTFVTLTYAPECLPANESLDPDEHKRFLKRLRKAIHPRKVRYYLVGEYGGKYGRPHYHAALFGLGIQDAESITRAWGMGNCHFGEVNPATMAYNCSHLTKGAHRVGDPRLDGRHPEFARMSLKPGIGAGVTDAMAEWLTTDVGSRWLAKEGDVNAVFRSDGQVWPLGRYLRKTLRRKAGREDQQPDKSRMMQALKIKGTLDVEGPDFFEVKRKQDGRNAQRVVKRISMRKTL